MNDILDSETNNVQSVRVKRRPRTRRDKLMHQLKRRGVQLRIIAAVAAITVVLFVSQLVLLTDGINQLNISYENFDRVLTGLSRQQSNELTLNDFERLKSSIDSVAQGISTLSTRLRFIRPLASLNTQWSAQITQLDVSRELISASQDMLNGLQPVLFFLLGESEESTVASRISGGARIVELLQIGRGQFISGGDHLKLARQILDEIPRGALSTNLLIQIGVLDDFYQQLQSTNTLLLQSPELFTFVLGLDDQRAYLLLATNNDELRPSGGYLSTFGWIVVRDGRIIDYDYNPTTATSPLPPIDSETNPYTIPEWWIQYDQPVYAAWDGSWFADFPSTAELAMWYYNAGNNRHSPVDGVISIDIVGFEYLLEALGTVELPEYDRTVTADNFRELVYDIRAFGQGAEPHKRFVADIFKAIFTDWQSIGGDTDQNNAIISALLKALQERHIMLYFDESEFNNVISVLNWSGEQPLVEEHDYLMVVDTNLGNKSNNSIIRQVTYDVSLQEDGTADSTLTIAYEYPASLAEDDPAVDEAFHGRLDYGNLLQIMTPLGSQLETTNDVVNELYTDEINSFTDFVTRIRVEYDTSERLQFHYNTPVVVDDLGSYKRYRLLLQKQPGSRTNRVNVQLSLPINTEVISSEPSPAQSYSLDNLILDYRIDLNTDQWIELVYLVR